jgi:Zn finger protein HypA/HybF involved in hydrogenase expression
MHEEDVGGCRICGAKKENVKGEVLDGTCPKCGRKTVMDAASLAASNLGY